MKNRYERMLEGSSDVGGVISDYVRNNVREYGDVVVTASRNIEGDKLWCVRAEPLHDCKDFARIDVDCLGDAPAVIIERFKDCVIAALMDRRKDLLGPSNG